MMRDEGPKDPRSTQPVVWAGIDWGTHSSKWAFFRGQDHTAPVVGPIRNSNLLRQDNRLTFSPPSNLHLKTIHSIKKRIISDPASPFWDGLRLDTQTTIGEAVAFSLVNLLKDLAAELTRRGIQRGSETPWDIGFSLPNWVEQEDEVQRMALRHFHQAVMVALAIFAHNELGKLPNPGEPFSIDQWRSLVAVFVEDFESSHSAGWGDGEQGISAETLARKDTYHVGPFRCSYIVESCAAGLPYLKAMGDPREDDTPKIRKLLVVDVGAGSTDIGYMLRTISPVDRQWVMNYFTPGNTHGLAGDDLTERIQRGLWDAGRRDVNFEEAQTEKERGVGGDWPATLDWIRGIARHGADYIRVIDDTVRLPYDPPLEIILTGGSGPSIPNLAQEIRRQVVEALQARGFGQIAGRTDVASVVLPEYGLSDAIAYARQIVSLGAADPEKPRLSHLQRLTRAEPGKIRVVTWRGSGG
jgi:hypothetical protein